MPLYHHVFSSYAGLTWASSHFRYIVLRGTQSVSSSVCAGQDDCHGHTVQSFRQSVQALVGGRCDTIAAPAAVAMRSTLDFPRLPCQGIIQSLFLACTVHVC